MTESWKQRGACVGAEPSVFLTDSAELVEEARKVCLTKCPVQQMCLYDSLRSLSVPGVWGGSTELERKTMRRMRPNSDRITLFLNPSLEKSKPLFGLAR